MGSTAVGTEFISKIVGYKIIKGDFSETSPNLPQRIAILGEANTANQGSLDTNGKEITTAQQAGQLYGFGSPIYHMMRILRPYSGTGIGGIPVIVYPQAAPGGATAKIVSITPSGVATGNGKHTIKIAGRNGLEGTFYTINIVKNDTTDDITAKIYDAVNAVLGSPVTAADTTYEVNLTTKWKGLTAQELVVSVDTGTSALGITYTVAEEQAGSGTPSIQAALDQFKNDWVTIVVNGYGAEDDIMDALEAFNGIPDPENPTGRYSATIIKPFIALTGSTADNPSTVTDARLNDVTIAICPAPGSAGFSFEAAANMCALFARQAQDTPHLDVSGMSYPDMPTPTSIGSMAVYATRDSYVKKGCSTVDLVGGRYVVEDFVTTYHPVGETPPQFRYCRNIMIDLNIRFTYYLLEQIHVVDHAIAADNDQVSAVKVVKPKQWKQVVFTMADDLADRALIVEPDFTQDSVIVNVGTSNPDRLETFMRYKRSGYCRIASTTVEAGFKFGTLN